MFADIALNRIYTHVILRHMTLNGQKAKLAAAAALAACLAFAITAASYVFPPYQEVTVPKFIVSTPTPLPRIYIREDGSIDPSTDALRCVGNIYTFTRDMINCTLVIQRDNIMIDGSGRTLRGYAEGNIKGDVGIVIYNRTNVTITALNIEEYWFAVNITSSSKITIKGNTLNSQWILVQSSTDCAIVENTIKGGIQITSSSGNVIAKNRISNAADGVFLCGSSFNIVEENVFENCDCAILIQGAFENVLDNHIRGGRTGIDIDGSNNKISGNYVEENSEAGISINFGNNNIICENTIENNRYGVIIGFVCHLNAENNTFYHNNFLNNAQNVLIRVKNFTNFWDNGKEGNYWSDYKGADDNKDGIGDTPYVINEHNRDNHPLMNPRPRNLIKQEMPPTLLMIPLATILGSTLIFMLLKIHVKRNPKIIPKNSPNH